MSSLVLLSILLCASDAPIENFHQVSERIYAGARPVEADFDVLRKLGIRTVISVESVRPGIGKAKESGLRYVHIPIKYSGIDDEAAAALQKTLKEREGPFYIHCHHGGTRGPSMAAVALVLDGGGDISDAVAHMKERGVSTKYSALWESIRNLDVQALRELDPELHEVAPVKPFTQEMALIGDQWDYVKAFKANGWQALEAYPDVTPSGAAQRIEERLRALTGTDKRASEEDFTTKLDAATRAAKALRESLEGGAADVDVRMDVLGASCNACHTKYRN